jgi:penicillin-binding protein 1A
MLGQGNRTALPICGYFLGSLLKDPAFQKYHAKFGASKDNSLTQAMYGCGGYLAMPSDSDSIAVDSLHVSESGELIEVQGDGSIKTGEADHENANTTPTPNNNGEATEKKD